jgi:hypothetical protein
MKFIFWKIQYLPQPMLRQATRTPKDGRREPKPPQRETTGAQGHPIKAPKGRQREPKAHEPHTRVPTSAPERRNGARGRPKGNQKESKIVPKHAQGTPKTPKRSQQSITYSQTPDQPPRRTLCHMATHGQEAYTSPGPGPANARRMHDSCLYATIHCNGRPYSVL